MMKPALCALGLGAAAAVPHAGSGNMVRLAPPAPLRTKKNAKDKFFLPGSVALNQEVHRKAPDALNLKQTSNHLHHKSGKHLNDRQANHDLKFLSQTFRQPLLKD